MPRPSSRYIEELAAKWEPRLRDAFLEAIQDLRSVNVGSLTGLIENSDIEGALRAVGLDPAAFTPVQLELTRIYNEGGIAAARTIPPARMVGGYEVQIRFDVRNPEAERIIREQSSTLVQDITDDQRTTVRSYLQRNLAQGANPRTAALDLVGRLDRKSGQRVGGVIGLHSTQEKWLASYTDDLASTDPVALRRLLDRGLRDKRFDSSVLKAIRDGTGIPADLQARMRLAYASRALRWRGENIARTETIRALGSAQTQAYEQAIANGLVDQDSITRYWVTVGDLRVRPDHRLIPGMNKQGRRWREPFATPKSRHSPTGLSLHAPHDTDIMCRCYERIRINFLASVSRRAA